MSTSFDELAVAKGSKAFHERRCADADGNEGVIPFYVIRGVNDGPTVCITAGVHGTEYAGIEASLRIYHELDPAHLSGTIIGCPVANYSAFVNRTMFVNPVDGKNLNFVFPGNDAGSITEVIAHVLLTEFVAHADYHIDMHSGDAVEDLFPYVFYHRSGKQNVDSSSRWMAEVFGLEYVAATELAGRGTSDQGNFYAAVSESGIPSIQPEAGGLGILEEKAVKTHYRGIERVLRGLQMLPSASSDDTPEKTTQPRELSHFLRPRTECDGLFYPQVAPGQKVEDGDLLGQVTDYRKESKKAELVADAAGVVLWVLATPVVRTGDALMGIGVF